MPTAKKQNEEYGAAETNRRFKAALQGAFNTPAKPLKSIQADTQKRRAAKKKSAK
jgi:hypothetical protein